MIIYTPIYRVDYSSLSKYCEEHFENIKSKNTLDDVPEYKIWIPTQALGGRADEVGSDLRFKIIKKRKGLFLKVRVSNIQFNLFAILLNCVVGCLSYFVAKSFIHIIYSLVVTLIVYYIYRARIYSGVLEFSVQLEKKVIHQVKNSQQNNSEF